MSTQFFPLELDRPDTGGMRRADPRTGNTSTVKLGLRSERNLLLPGESAADFAALLQAYVEQLRPTTAAEHQSVARLVGLRWKVLRADAHEDALLRAELDRKVAQSEEQRVLDLVMRAATLASAFVEMIPSFSKAPPHEAEATLLSGFQALVSMVDAVAAKKDLPVGVLGDLAGLADRLRLDFALESSAADFDALYRQQLLDLDYVVRRVIDCLTSVRAACDAELAQKQEELRHGVRLGISVVRVLDRYRAALERSTEREMAHLAVLREHGREFDRTFGSGKPLQWPPVEIRVVQ